MNHLRSSSCFLFLLSFEQILRLMLMLVLVLLLMVPVWRWDEQLANFRLLEPNAVRKKVLA